MPLSWWPRRYTYWCTAEAPWKWGDTTEVFSLVVDLDSETDWTEVFFLGDCHEGNCNSDTAALRRGVETIRAARAANPHVYTILMGDLADCIINAKDPRWDPIEVSRRYNIADMKDLPYKQVDYVAKILGPVDDTIIAALIGNHEEQYIRRHSYNVYGHFCEKFHNVYELGYVGFVKFFLRERGVSLGSIDVALNHGAGGGGKREGYPINAVHDVFRWMDADYHIMGHLHVLVTDCKDKIAPNAGGNDIRQRKEWYGISGCFLRTFVNGNRNYFEHKGRPQSDIGMLHARFRIPRQTIGGQRQRVKDMELEKVWL